MKREFVFNRRVVADQEIYIRAENYAEALRLVQMRGSDDAADQVIIKVTHRHLPDPARATQGEKP